ncbi:putative l-ascorbate peroxidase 6 [Quercus suber]|uniref:L-ascorbate peroxidase 6 n=1 Tax=Quercus suber TaxID=58331 RepID=A0AAW0L250_QUESU
MGSMACDDAGPSHTFAHGDTSRSLSMRCDDTCPPTSPTTSPLPTTRMFPSLTTSTAPADVHGIDEMRFMPTLGAVPPEFVHSEFSQTQIPAPPPEASHIPDRPRRPQRTQTHPPDCGTRHVFACVLFRQGETSQGTSDEKKTGMIKLSAYSSFSLVFHDAGTFDMDENSISWADMIAVAGAEAVSLCGGPTIPVPLGRLDSMEPDPEGKLPQESLDAPGLKQSFQRKGLSAVAVNN